MKPFALLAVALFLPQQPNAAEEMFKKLEEKLAKAESIQVAYRMSFEQQKSGREKISGLLSGNVLLQEGGKARLDTEGVVGSKYSAAVVSDGKITIVSNKEQAIAAQPTVTAPTLKRDATLFLTRLGGESAVHEIIRSITLGLADQKQSDEGKTPAPRETDPSKLLRLSQFRAGPSEKVDGREVGAIQFVAEKAGKPGKAVVTLWIDSATLLPVRRRIHDEEEGLLVEETYSVFKVNEKIDPAKFELPKDKK